MKFGSLNLNITPEQLEKMFALITALRDDEHWAVWIYLMDNGEPHSLTTIRTEFNSTYHEIKPILEDLIIGGLVEEFIFFEDEVGDLSRRFYRSTTLGYRFYVGLMESILPGSKRGLK